MFNMAWRWLMYLRLYEGILQSDRIDSGILFILAFGKCYPCKWIYGFYY